MTDYIEDQNLQEKKKEKEKDKRLNMVMFLTAILAIFSYIIFEYIFKEPAEEDSKPYILNEYNDFIKSLTGSKLENIYKGSRDGFRPKDFHQKCDRQGPTLTIARTKDKKHVFGGYTSIEWSENGNLIQDDSAFLFYFSDIEEKC